MQLASKLGFYKRFC